MSKDKLDYIYNTVAQMHYGPMHILKIAAKGEDMDAFDMACDQVSSMGAMVLIDGEQEELDTHRMTQEALAEVLRELIEAPQSFVKPVELFERLQARGAPFEKTFTIMDKVYMGSEGMIWSLGAKSSKPGMDKIAGVLTAEHICYNLMRDPRWTLDAQVLSHIAEKVGQDNVLKIQHALVDYVQGEGKSLPINRAAPKLYRFATDYEPEMVRLWSEKLEGFHVKTKYSLKDGDIKTASFDFGAP